jgi:hypothetical protein
MSISSASAGGTLAHCQVRRHDRRQTDAVGEFSFSGPHAVTATSWTQPGALDDKVSVTVDLAQTFDKLAVSANERDP